MPAAALSRLSFAGLRIGTALGIGATLLLYGFGVANPGMPQAGLDASWVAVTGEAAAAGTRWGADLVFTYGPGAVLVTSYYTTEFFSHTLPLDALLALGFGLCAACQVLEPWRRGRRLAPPMLALAMLAFILLAASLTPDCFFFSLSLVVFLQGLAQRDRLGTAALVLGLLALGVTAITKTSYLLLELPLLALLDGRHVALRRLPKGLPLYGLGFIGAYLFCHQRLADLPLYCARQFSVVAGYSDAMGMPGPGLERAIFLAAGAALVAVALACERRTVGRRDGIVLLLGLMLYIAVLAKAGFTRYGEGHVVIAFTSLAMGFLLYGARLACRPGRAGAAASPLCIGFGLLLIVLATPPEFGATPGLGRFYAFAKDRVRPTLQGRTRLAFSALADPAGFLAWLDEDKRRAWRKIRVAHDLPPLPGRVDIIPSEQSVILAHGLDYHPRPSFQEYSTYTPSLIAANQAFFEGPQAPDWIVFAPGSIDDRYPASAEGASWPDFLRLYGPARWLQDAVALRRRAAPLPDLLGPTVARNMPFGEFLPLSSAGPIFARIRLHKTLRGVVEGLLVRPPLLWMTIRLRDGQERRYRFVPALGEAGFVLSPLVETAVDYAEIATGAAANLKDREVVAVKIDGTAAGRAAFEPDIAVELRPIDSGILAAAQAARSRPDDLDPNIFWQDLIRAADQPRDRDRLAVQVPSAVMIPVLGARRLRFGYGFTASAGSHQDAQTVCFAVQPSPPGPAPLWQACPDLLGAAADAEEQAGDIALPPGTAAVTLTTRCQDRCPAGRAYWSRFSAE